MTENQSLKDPIPYSLLMHRHRFAAWCGSTAASASPKCRFKVSTGVKILNKLDICYHVASRTWLSNDNFDSWHTDKCKALVSAAKGEGIQGFTYGVAAKMLNCYVKAFWIGEEEVLAIAHPPIDRVLLECLEKLDVGQSRQFWKQLKNIGWSSFGGQEYNAAIAKIRESLRCKRSMWKIEEYWQGFQN